MPRLLPADTHPVKRQLMQLLGVLGLTILVIVAAYLLELAAESRRKHEVAAFHEPALRAAAAMNAALQRMRAPLGVSDTYAASLEDEAAFIGAVSSQFRRVIANGRFILQLYVDRGASSAEEARRLSRALDALLRVEHRSAGDLRALAKALVSQTFYAEIVSLQLLRTHELALDDLERQANRSRRIFWIVFVLLGVSATSSAAWLVRRNFRGIEGVLHSERDMALHLAESEQIFRAAFDSSPLGMVLSHADGRMFRANPAFSAMLGYSIEELERLDFLAITHDEDRPHNQLLLRETIAGQRAGYDYEKRYWRKSGELIWVRVVTAAWRNAHGDIAGVLSQVEDITERRRVAQELEHERAFIDAVLSNAAALVLVLDREGRIVRFNRACEELSQYDFAEVRGRHPWDFLLPPEERDEVREQAFLALAHEPKALQASYTNHWLTKSRETRLIEWSNALLLGADGAMEFMVAVGTDVTERKAVAEALKRSEETYAHAEKITHIGSWDWDIVRGGLRWSDEIYRIFGRTPRSFGATYQAFLDYIHPEDRQQVIDAVNAAVADPAQAYSVPHRVVRPDGSIRLVHERGTVYRDAAGKPVRMIGTVHDITEQQAMEERLRSALHEKELLLKEIYHRVKNNLQVVSSLLVLQGRSTSDAAARALLEDSANRVKSMALVHEQLYQSGDLVRIGFATYVSQLVAHLRETYSHNARVTLRTEIEDAQLGIETAVPLGLIINELVSNVYKHAFADGGEGEILLRLARMSDGQLELLVSDTGRGLPADFNPRRSRSLGMRLVMSLSEQLGGDFSFAAGEGGGTRFVLRFTPELQEEERLRSASATATVSTKGE